MNVGPKQSSKMNHRIIILRLAAVLALQQPTNEVPTGGDTTAQGR